jgi:hypothetical protein
VRKYFRKRGSHIWHIESQSGGYRLAPVAICGVRGYWWKVRRYLSTTTRPRRLCRNCVNLSVANKPVKRKK